MKHLLLVSFALIALTALGQKKTTGPDKRVAELDAYIQKAARDWNVPGLAVSVVQNNNVLLAKGYGTRDKASGAPVNEETLFACASTTKAMTAVCMGMLVDEGKLSWDDRVQQYLPEFILHDPYVTRELRVRDLFIHNSGVGNADFLWSLMDVPTETILKKMRDVEPEYSFRSSFIYQNILYIAAGEVIHKVSGKRWEDFIRERIFSPLGMTRTASMRKLAIDQNMTVPHDRIEGTIQPIGYTKDDAVGPAGSVWSSIDDMSKWMRCMLDSSKYSGGRLLSAKTWTEVFRPQTLVPASEFYPTMEILKPNWMSYGLGWFQHDYKGHKINYHTGSLAGLVAIHAQLPDEKLGIYVFGNLDHAEVRHALVYKTFDLFALGGSRDWSSEFKTLYDGLRKKSEQAQNEFESKRVTGTKPTWPLEDYAGTYTDPLYGEVIVTLQGKNLSISMNNTISATLEHWHYETFRGWFDKKWYGKVNATFELGGDGKIQALNLMGIVLKRN